jgi:diguanylate cyclase (GGDEF)-like protein/PAS domain S-box-containing protein
MDRTWRRLLGRLADGLPEARYEAVIAVLRSCLCLTGAVAMLLTTSTTDRLVVPALVTLAIGAVSAGLVGVLALQPTVERARRWGSWSTAGDLALFAGYSAAFSGRPGASGFYGVFVLVMGPVRYGWRGLLWTAMPVAVIAGIWPQVDTHGVSQPFGQVVLLCLLLSLPVIMVRAIAMRGSARLRQAEQQFATAFEHASIGMALADLDLQVQQANRSLGVLLGESPHELVGSRLDAAVDRLDRPRLHEALHGLSSTSPSTRLEVRLRRPDGGLRWGHVSASLLDSSAGVAARIVVQIENITERKRSEAMMSHAAAHDALTDLPNRSLLLARLEAAMHRGEQVAVLFLDLDRFKIVNDGLGHAAGDLLLVQVALRLRDVMRPDDLVARIGGDEFVVLCRQADLEIATGVAERVLEALNRPLPTGGGNEAVIGASIGIAIAGPDDTAEVVLRDADTAMYAAKGAGGGRVHVFSTALREAVINTHELEVDLRAALRAGQLSLVYQPVVHAALGWVMGCEALARWTHPRRGQVTPTEFIAVAEQSDLILELGDWVLRQALEDIGSWPTSASRPVPTVAVNVSLRQLLAPAFPERVKQLLKAADVEPPRLCLEVTETVLAGDVEPVILVLQALRSVGVRLSIDDFGTGHASLTYLARFPVDQVKVDQTFVAGLGIDAGSAAIVGGVVAMAHTFDLRVIAEGVETEEQLAALRSLGCDGVQGFLLGVPMSQRDLCVHLRRQAPDATVELPSPRQIVEHVSQDPSYDEQRMFHLLIKGAKDVTGRLDLETVLEQAFLVLMRTVEFSGGSIQLVEDQQVRIAAGFPQPSAEALASRIPLGQGVSGSIAVTGEPRYLPDITIASTVTAGRRASSSSSGVRSWFGVPLIAEGNPIGVLQIDSTTVDAFSERDRLAVLAFAPVVALAVVCARHNAQQLRVMQSGREHP